MNILEETSSDYRTTVPASIVPFGTKVLAIFRATFGLLRSLQGYAMEGSLSLLEHASRRPCHFMGATLLVHLTVAVRFAKQLIHNRLRAGNLRPRTRSFCLKGRSVASLEVGETYSVLSASITSTLAARIAGKADAMTAAARRTAVAPITAVASGIFISSK